MTIGVAAMMVGVFLVPALLLWAGHRLRRRNVRVQRAFWGGIGGHVTALLVGTLAAMMPPEQWSADDALRGALGLWSWVLLPTLGALAGAVSARRETP
jgi:hypothetical protein